MVVGITFNTKQLGVRPRVVPPGPRDVAVFTPHEQAVVARCQLEPGPLCKRVVNNGTCRWSGTARCSTRTLTSRRTLSSVWLCQRALAGVWLREQALSGIWLVSKHRQVFGSFTEYNYVFGYGCCLVSELRQVFDSVSEHHRVCVSLSASTVSEHCAVFGSVGEHS